MKRNYLPGPIIDVEGIVPVLKGGTDADNGPQALANLGLVAISKIGSPLGPIPINETTGMIESGYFNNLFSSSVEIQGKMVLDPNESTVFEITNYDSRLVYTVTADYGTITISGSTITYTAPNTLNASIGFTINDVYFSLDLTLSEKIPNTPTITEPSVDFSGNSNSVFFVSSDWSSNYTDDIHYSSDWQIATDPDFLVIVSEALEVTSQKTTFSLTTAVAGNIYYVRVRHKGGFGSSSEWSLPRIYTCLDAVNFDPPIITFPVSDGNLNNSSVTFNTSNFVSRINNLVHTQTEWEVSLNDTFGVDTINIVSADVNLRTLTRTLIENQFLYVRVRFYGSLDGGAEMPSGWSETRTVRYIALVTNNQPVIITPSTNSNIDDIEVAITGSEFVSSGSPAAFFHVNYATNSLFTENLIQFSIDSIGTSVPYLFNNLQVGSTYYFKIRYEALDGSFTPWSLERVVTISRPAKPTIISPSLNEVNVNLDINILASNFSMVGRGEQHLNSDWVFSFTSTFDVIEHSSYNNTANLLIYPRVNLLANKVYYVKTRQRSVSGFTSEWSNTVNFTTIVNKFVSTEVAFINSIENEYPNLLTMSSIGDRLCISRSKDAVIYRITSSGLVAELTVDNKHFNGLTLTNAGRGYLSINPEGTKAVHILICNPDTYSGTFWHLLGEITITSYTRTGTSTAWVSESSYRENLYYLNNGIKDPPQSDNSGRYEINRYVGYKPNGKWEFHFSFLYERSTYQITSYVAESTIVNGNMVLTNGVVGSNVLSFDRCNFHNFAGVTSLVISADPIVSTGVVTGTGITLGTSKISVTELSGTKTEICTITGLDLNKDTPYIPRYVAASANCKVVAFYDKTRKGVVVLK